MLVKSKLFLVNYLSSLSDLSRMKKRVLFLTFLIIVFLLSSTRTYVPGSKVSEIHYKFTPISDKSLFQSMMPSKTERLNKGKEVHLNKEERGLEVQAPSFNVEFVGMWPYVFRFRGIWITCDIS